MRLALLFLPFLRRVLSKINLQKVGSVRVRYITYINSIYSAGICFFVRSAISSGIATEILGLHEHDNIEINNLLRERNASRYVSKVYAVSWYLNRFIDTNHVKFEDDDIILFLDGADTLHVNENTTEGRLVEKFLKLEQGRSVIFSAERQCYPRSTLCNLLSSHFDETSNQSTFRYVNTGGWIARHGIAKRFVKKWIELIEEQQGKREDQLAVHNYIFRKKLNDSFFDIDVVLDRQCTIFQTSHLTSFSMGDWNVPVYNVIGPYLRADGFIFNSETTSFPLFLHFNGIKFFLSRVADESKAKSVSFKKFGRCGNTLRISRPCALYSTKYPILLSSCFAKNVSIGC